MWLYVLFLCAGFVIGVGTVAMVTVAKNADYRAQREREDMDTVAVVVNATVEDKATTAIQLQQWPTEAYDTYQPSKN